MVVSVDSSAARVGSFLGPYISLNLKPTPIELYHGGSSFSVSCMCGVRVRFGRDRKQEDCFDWGGCCGEKEGGQIPDLELERFTRAGEW